MLYVIVVAYITLKLLFTILIIVAYYVIWEFIKLLFVKLLLVMVFISREYKHFASKLFHYRNSQCLSPLRVIFTVFEGILFCIFHLTISDVRYGFQIGDIVYLVWCMMEVIMICFLYQMRQLKIFMSFSMSFLFVKNCYELLSTKLSWF